ncbi:MAG: Gfo/Idh/MocA family oxidoreductase [Planctomycetota bacterium]
MTNPSDLTSRLASDRRRFLAQSAAVVGGLAGLAAASGSAAAAKPTTPTVKAKPGKMPGATGTIGIGVIGPGGMGTGHCRAFTEFAKEGLEDLEIVAVADACDLHATKAAEAVAAISGSAAPQTYRDYRELLARDDIHAVIIASPEHWHAQHAIDALTAGKDVYLEKPATLTMEQMLDLRKTFDKHSERVLQVGTQMILQPKFVEARKAIKQGKIGKPVWSQTSYCRNSYDGEWNYYKLNPEWKPGVNLDWDAWLGYLPSRDFDPMIMARWRRYREFSTGIVGDLLVHVLAPMLHALDLDLPTRVTGTGSHIIDKAMENHDQTNINIQFGHDDHHMVLAGSTANAHGLETLIRGHEANMFLNGRNVDIRPERIYADDIDPEIIECADIGSDHHAMRRDWLKCLRTREQPIGGVELATRVMIIVDLATKSMWDGHAWMFDKDAMIAKRV